MTPVGKFLAAMVSPLSDKPPEDDTDNAPVAALPTSSAPPASYTVTLSPEAKALEHMVDKGLAGLLRPSDEDSEGKSEAELAQQTPTRKVSQEELSRLVTNMNAAEGAKTPASADGDAAAPRGTDRHQV